MRRIVNPFPREMNRCFGCSADNASGLKMEFFDDGEEVYSDWDPRPDLQGWVNVLHGGIQASLLDELCSWAVLVRAGTAGVTSSMNIRYLRPVYINRGPLHIRARLERTEGSEAILQARIENAEGVTCTEAEVIYFIVPEAVARRRYHYPGQEAFFAGEEDHS